MVFELAGQDTSAEAARLNNLGAHFYSEGNFADAERMYRAALDKKPPDSLSVATIWNNLAVLRKRQYRSGDAEADYQKALDLRRKLLGSLHAEVAGTLNDLGLACERTGHYQRAGALFEEALRILEASDPGSRDLANVMNNLSVIERIFKRNDQAAGLLRRSLSMKERALGPDNPDVGVSLNNLAKVLEDQNERVAAGALYSRAIAIFEKCGQNCVENTAIALASAGSLMAREQRYDEAEAAEKRALGLLDSEGHRDPSITAFVLNNLGDLYTATKRFEEAELSFQRCLSVQEQLFRPDHPLLIETLRAYGGLLRHMGKKTEAQRVEIRAAVLAKEEARENPMGLTIDVATLRALH
jgi:tetratricopeptide (TPR) repeat protein